MKKKGHHAIPDFSRAKPGASAATPREQPHRPRPAAATRPSAIKPQATSAKSGRRGQ